MHMQRIASISVCVCVCVSRVITVLFCCFVRTNQRV